MIRKPAVSGQFYPADEKRLRAAIAGFTPETEGKTPALGLLCPHAGYSYCGAVAGETFSRIRVPPVVLILNPSHSFYNPPFALWSGAAWETPLGRAPVHSALHDELSALDVVTGENRLHQSEHAGEVVLPFVQYHRPDVEIAVLCIAASASTASLLKLGREIASCLERIEARDALVVASSDLSHEQGPAALETVNEKDAAAIDRMEKLQPEELLRICSEKNISMCGAQPAAAMMESVKARRGQSGELVRRATSADSSFGRSDYVVGYAGMIFR